MNLNMDLKNLDISKIKENKYMIFVIVVILITGFLSKKIWEMQSTNNYLETKQLNPGWFTCFLRV